MCEQDVVERVADLLDTRLWAEAARTEGWRPTYVAQIAGHRAAEWMGALRPYMGLRRTASIDAALAAYHPIRLTEAPAIWLYRAVSDRIARADSATRIT